MFLTKYHSGDKIEKNEVDWACRTYRGQQKCIQGFGGKLRERGHLESLNVGGRIILKWTFRKWDRGMD